mgnify:FL=1
MSLKNWLKMHKIEIMIFIFVLLFIPIYNLINYNELYTSSGDGDLYISIAENFLQTSHFIQNVRPHEINMVVPPGLPSILTILYFIGHTTSFVIFVQYLLFALFSVVLYKAINNFYPNKIISILGVIIYCFSDAILTSTGSPRYIMTEVYTQFIFIAVLYVMSIKKYNFEVKAKLLMPILLIGSLIRTVLFTLFFIDIVIYIVLLIKNKHSFKFLLKFSIVVIAILSINTMVNFRETGEFIPIQNYGAIPIYQANNANTSTKAYSSSISEQFSDDYFFEVYNNKELTTSEKSRLLSEETKKYVMSNLSTVIKNALIKFKNMFITPYYLDFYVWVIGSIILFVVTRRKELIYLFFTNLIIMILTSFGLNIFRYSIFATIAYTFVKVGLIFYLFKCVMNKVKLCK